jgi:hypothetical protein
MRLKASVFMAAIISAAMAPSIASADPTLLTILALSAMNGGAVAPTTSQPVPPASVDADPFGDVLPDVFGGDEGADRISAGVSWHGPRVYHCHRRHRCHAHR